MNGKYSYIDVAHDDLTAANEMLNAKLYNHAVRLCQQYIEKVFKECLTLNGTDELDLFLLHTHKLSRLAERCGELIGVKFSRTEIAFFRELTDYYFDTNYPGENYVKIAEAKAVEVLNETIQFKEQYEESLATK
ncbi:MAG: HEPN domain-containing protein [Defluviitaleaceae bacterium]|nr:HEPN domain-containing protein [Defluviitaleaceae bacterium]MCL2261621.1 HEPN domain-containing protein [Defluviitaleaceae bacterium]